MIRRFGHHPSEKCSEREQGARDGLRGAVACEKIVRRDPAGRDGLLLQKRQHDVTAAKHQSTRAVEGFADLDRLTRVESDQRWKSEQQDTEEDQRDSTHRAGNSDFVSVLSYATGV